MKKYLLKFIIGIGILLIGVLLTVTLRRERSLYKQEIKPPLLGYDLSYQEYTFDADSGIVVERSTGTFIKVPPYAFVNSKGETVKGKISLNVREFHGTEDLFRTGIPMSIDSSRSGFLASAGMIELRATANGEKIELASDKKAEIELASFKNAEGYRLYHLKDDKNWSATDTFAHIKNERKSIKLNLLNQQLADDTTKEILVDFVSNLATTPELIPFKGLQWKVKEKDVTEEFKEALRVNWNDVRISRRGERYKFDLKLVLSGYGEKSKSVKKFSFLAMPLKNGSKLTKNEISDLSRINDSAKIKIENEIQRVKKEADLLNSFQINRMGIWNIDKLMMLNAMSRYEVSFDFEKELDLEYSNIMLYVLYLDDNSVIPYGKSDWDKILLQSERKVSMKAVLPNNKIAVVEENDVVNEIKSKRKKLYFKTKKI